MDRRKNSRLVITVDPGKAAGIAAWRGELLDWQRLAELQEERGNWDEAALVATEKIRSRYDEEDIKDAAMHFEIPQFYGTGGKRENDLVGCLLMPGALAGYLGLRPGTTTSEHVRDWKGAVPKNVMVNRIEPEEITPTPTSTQPARAPDVVGIGLHYHGRLRK